MSEDVSSIQKIWNFFKFKLFYGATLKGMITFTIVYLFVIVLFLSTFSAPIVEILGAPLIPIYLAPGLEEKASRLVMLYHAIALPFIAVCTYFVLEFQDVREQLVSRIKWPLFIGSMMASISGFSFAYIFNDAWILHGLYLTGLAITFYAGIMLLIGVFPWKSFPKRVEDGPYIFGFNVEQVALTALAICVLISVILGAAIGSFFGNGLVAFLAEYTLRSHEGIPTIFVDGVKAHLHIMLGLIDAIILLVVYRYTFPEQKGRWYRTSFALSIPGFIVMSLGSWLVTFGDAVQQYFDPHYLIYVGGALLLFVALVLALTGWNKMSKEFLGDEYETASWITRMKSVFRDPLRFALYFEFIWVNFAMTFGGIFLALSLRDDSIFTRVLGIPSFRAGPEFVEITVARGHWHVLAVLSAFILLLMFIDYLDIQGMIRKVMGWLIFVGSVFGFGAAVIYLYYPHVDPKIMDYLNSTLEAYQAATPIIGISFYIIDIGILLLGIALVVFCFHQFIDIVKGRKDLENFPG